MNILFASSEAVPFAVSGGLAEVAGALPKALKAKGEDVRVILPLYGSVTEEQRAEMIDSLKTYYKVSMELLEPENRKALLDPKNPIATKIADNVPTLYGENSKAGNSLIADGCTIEGTVENSLLFRGVVVEKGAVVKNSILMQGTVIHANAKVDSIITDKNVTITANRNLSGDPSYPIYFTKNIVV